MVILPTRSAAGKRVEKLHWRVLKYSSNIYVGPLHPSTPDAPWKRSFDLYLKVQKVVCLGEEEVYPSLGGVGLSQAVAGDTK